MSNQTPNQFCPYCGGALNPGSKFCMGCGNDVSAFTAPASQPAQYMVNGQVQPVSEGMPVYNQQQDLSNPDNKKAFMKKFIIGILVSFVAFFAISMIVGILSDSSSVDFTKGEVKDGYYVNEWADIKFEITDDFPEGSKNAYAIFENNGMECGYVCYDTMTGKILVIGFGDAGKFSSEEMALENAMQGGLSALEEEGFDYEFSDTYKMDFGGNEFLCTEMEIDGVKFVVGVKKIDGKMVFFEVFAQEDTVEDFFESVEPFDAE